MEILALIPARSGSKGVRHKNILNYCGKPLMVHSIEQAKSSRLINRVIVSTDSEMYAKIAREAGAEAPFLRPPEISGDHATDLETFHHALNWLQTHEGYRPDLCVHLRPTHPNRSVKDIEVAIDLLLNHSDWDSVRSVVPAPETPFKMWFLRSDGALEPVVTKPIGEAHSQPRQTLPSAYLQNASIDVIRTRTILLENSMAGKHVGALVMSEFYDIDSLEQMQTAAQAFRRNSVTPSGKTFCIDIDGVIASLAPSNDYTLAEPLTDNIGRINRLYALNNKIILFTARGSLTGKNWTEMTRQQMERWGVKYHELCFGKPAADFYVDDRFVSLADFAALADYHGREK